MVLAELLLALALGMGKHTECLKTRKRKTFREASPRRAAAFYARAWPPNIIIKKKCSQ